MGGDTRTGSGVPVALSFSLQSLNIPDSAIFIDTATDKPYYLKANVVTALVGGGPSAVLGPASAVDGNVVLFDGTTGKLIKDGGTLGTAAFTASSAYATSAQGSKADTALQPSTSISVVAVTASGLISANLGLSVASGQAITPAQVVGIVGTTTNNNAQAGSIGEYVESIVALGAGVSLSTTATAQDVTTISLTAGDWDVSLNASFDNGSVTSQMNLWIGTTSGNSSAELLAERAWYQISGITAGGSESGSVPSFRMSLAGTTTVRFKAKANWTGTAPNVYGRISARRVR